MKPSWLIEAGVYGSEADVLLTEIRRQGIAASLLPFSGLLGSTPVTAGGRLVGEEDCVVSYGTFPFARQVQLHRRWVPGAWSNPQNLDFTTWCSYFGRFLLNRTYTILPGVEAIRQQDWLYQCYAVENTVFVRPAACNKLFTGRCVTKEGFAGAVAPARYDPATLVVVSAPKMVGREWRVVISEDRVVAASQYAHRGEKDIVRGCPKDVPDFVEAVLAEVWWRPDPIFMMDVAEANGRLWIVELSGFSTSWLYACDLTAVVAAASDLATREWAKARAGQHQTSRSDP